MSEESKPVGIVKFIDESDSFAHGFECGKIWKMLSDKQEIVDLPVYKANHAIIERMCLVFRKQAVFKPIHTIEEYQKIWCSLTVEPLLKIVK